MELIADMELIAGMLYKLYYLVYSSSSFIYASLF